MKLSLADLFLLQLLLSSSCFGLAISASIVRSLPGFQGPLPFQLETGYIGVDELDDVQLFYYFIESERNPRKDPLILWLTGGPGCSALSGLVYEIGPLNFNIVEYNGSLPTFVLNPYSWTKIASIIFIDSPVGTGFSYSKSSYGWKTNDKKTSEQTYSFLSKWLNDHPKFSKNPFYIAGDSYSGIVIPIILQEIVNGNEERHKPLINLKRYILGNPLTDKNVDENAAIPFAHRMALVSDELYALTKTNCKRDYVNVDSRNVECTKNLQAISECTKSVNNVHILERKCALSTAKPNDKQENRRSLDEISVSQGPQFGCRDYNYLLSYYWADDESVRDALHIKKGTIGRWRRCNSSCLSYINEVRSVVVYHLNLSTRGYRALVYSGDHDMKIPYLGTEAWIKSLNFSIIDDWRPWFVNSQVAGYTRTYSNRMTFATVKGGGHTAPEYKPKECFAMLRRWLSHTPL